MKGQYSDVNALENIDTDNKIMMTVVIRRGLYCVMVMPKRLVILMMMIL